MGNYRFDISIDFSGEKVRGKKGEKWGNIRKRKKQKRIRPRRVPTDADSESGRTQLPQKGEIPKKGKNKKEFGLVVSQADPDSSSPGRGRGIVKRGVQ